MNVIDFVIGSENIVLFVMVFIVNGDIWKGLVLE